MLRCEGDQLGAAGVEFREEFLRGLAAPVLCCSVIVVPEGNILIGRAAACWALDFGFPWLPGNAKQ